MAHDRDAHVDEPAHDVEHRSTTFEFHRRCAALQKAARVSNCFLDADLISEERHVRDHEGVLGAAGDGARVVNHCVERNSQRVLMTEDD